MQPIAYVQILRQYCLPLCNCLAALGCTGTHPASVRACADTPEATMPFHHAQCCTHICMSMCFTTTGIAALAGWAAAMLLIYTWWQQLHNKRGTDPGSLLEDSSTPLRGAQHRSSLQRHHQSPAPENLQLSTDEVQSEAQLDVESSGSSDRGVLARTFKRRRPPSSSTLPLLGQSHH